MEHQGFSWFSGYIIIHLEGQNQERFLNLAMQKNIDILETRWLADDLLEAKAGFRDLRSLEKIATVTHCQMKVKRGRGLPFAYSYAKNRKTLTLGLGAFLVALFVLSSLVFQVRVIPQEEITDLDLDVVQAKAYELGLRPGAIYKSLILLKFRTS